MQHFNAKSNDSVALLLVVNQGYNTLVINWIKSYLCINIQLKIENNFF